jgi:hypothetical protein
VDVGTIWPEWVTDEVFQAAFNLADATIRATADDTWKKMSAASIDIPA